MPQELRSLRSDSYTDVRIGDDKTAATLVRRARHSAPSACSHCARIDVTD